MLIDFGLFTTRPLGNYYVDHGRSLVLHCVEPCQGSCLRGPRQVGVPRLK